MPWALIFIALLVSCCLLAWRYGQTPERLCAVMMVGALVSTRLAHAVSQSGYRYFDQSVFLVDIALLAGFLYITFRYDRFWVLWATGFHIVAVVTRTAIIANPEIAPWAYARGIIIWSYLDLVALAAGIWFEARPARRRMASRLS